MSLCFIVTLQRHRLPGKDFKNLRQDATFQLVPTRATQAETNKEIKNQETIQGME